MLLPVAFQLAAVLLAVATTTLRMAKGAAQPRTVSMRPVVLTLRIQQSLKAAKAAQEKVTTANRPAPSVAAVKIADFFRSAGLRKEALMMTSSYFFYVILLHSRQADHYVSLQKGSTTAA